MLCDTVTDAATDAAFAANPLSETLVDGIRKAFRQSSAEGLFTLAGLYGAEKLPPDILFWQSWARSFFQSVCQLDEERLAQFANSAETGLAEKLLPSPDDLALTAWIAEAPPMRGWEYLTPQVGRSLWSQLIAFVRNRGRDAEGLKSILRQVNPLWHLLGRVTFHLAENKRDESRPFAFLATYTHRLSSKASVQHLPLAQALSQYASERDQAKLAELLAPVREAADKSSLIKQWLESRSLFQPHSLTISQAHRFLLDVPILEQAGLIVRVPNWWQSRKPPRPAVQIKIGERPTSALGANGLLDFSVDVVLDGETLTARERKQLLAGTEGLMLLRGKWVEVNREKLNEALSRWNQLEKEHAGGINFLRGMRLLAGVSLAEDEALDGLTSDWATVSAGDWLQKTLEQIRSQDGEVGCTPGDGLNATLRPYQADGVRWLWFMTQLGLGACLADDMGLGKTIQVIDLLLRLHSSHDSGSRAPVNKIKKPPSRTSLLVVPASLIGNWKQELARFAPQLNTIFAHRSECDVETLNQIAKEPYKALAKIDVVVTTYTLVRKADWICGHLWNLIVLDEAQAIKNAGSTQTRSVKKLSGAGRIVLTGTPIENQLGDLWSLCDFCSPGLLGTATQFKDFVKRLDKQQDANAYGALRRLVQPYILRRLKTDPTIISDLPEKTEMRAECGLTKKQAALYQQIIEDLARQLEAIKLRDESDGIQRRGLVLATLMRLKQVCNHPSQYLDQREFAAEDSGKFSRLAALCEPIAERQEKMLVFTQFQSICEPLAKYLGDVFGRKGLVLHGGVPVGKRKELVQRFQEEDDISFFVISVKAGGTGLNLTAASHVVHFDRWWNPAVENQATDRAFRIGQKRNVMVHKFVCRGTLEERIDQMIRDKQELADKVLGQKREGETLLTEMSDSELLKFVALDITRAAEEN